VKSAISGTKDHGFCRREQTLRYRAAPQTAAVTKANITGSGTAATAAAPTTGAPANVGSKMNVPPAPTVKRVPMGKTVPILGAERGQASVWFPVNEKR